MVNYPFLAYLENRIAKLESKLDTAQAEAAYWKAIAESRRWHPTPGEEEEHHG